MKIKFIINPTAGNGQALKTQDRIHRILDNTDHFFSIEKTSAPREATHMAHKAVAEKYDVLVAVGGDGTIFEVINGMAGSDVLLGIIPAGTGNDLARTAGIPRAVNEALQMILQPHVSPIDIGRLNGKYFVNVASIGFDAQVVQQCNHMKKFAPGPLPYVLSVLKTLIGYKNKHYKILLDGKLLEREILLISIANGKYYGGGMMIAPDAAIDDGYFDVCIINKMSKFRILTLFPTIFKGTHIRLPEVEYFKAKHIKIFANNMIINCDGEIVSNIPVDFSMADFKLNLIVNKRVKNPAHQSITSMLYGSTENSDQCPIEIH